MVRDHVVIIYEYPLNERIRTMLRLEDLFEKTSYFLNAAGQQEHHVAVLTLFEILEVASRADLKFDLLQELERQRQILLAFRDNPGISESVLSGTLYDIEQASAALFAMAGKIGHYLRENEWLMSIKSRAAIPGGVCEFDLPSYHYWLHQASSVRQHDLSTWLNPMLPIRDALNIMLRLLRANGKIESHVAQQGSFYLTMGGRNAQMLRFVMEENVPIVPEISGNRYAMNIRFSLISPKQGLRPKQVDTDVAFDMTFCSL